MGNENISYDVETGKINDQPILDAGATEQQLWQHRYNQHMIRIPLTDGERHLQVGITDSVESKKAFEEGEPRINSARVGVFDRTENILGEEGLSEDVMKVVSWMVNKYQEFLVQASQSEGGVVRPSTRNIAESISAEVGKALEKATGIDKGYMYYADSDSPYLYTVVEPENPFEDFDAKTLADALEAA